MRRQGGTLRLAGMASAAFVPLAVATDLRKFASMGIRPDAWRLPVTLLFLRLGRRSPYAHAAGIRRRGTPPPFDDPAARHRTVVMRLSIVVPALEEAAGIAATLAALQPLRAEGHEVIVVDGGSRDSTRAIAQPLADRVLVTAPGRAAQMNAGARAAAGDALLFLHADSLPPLAAATAIARALAGGARWGRFDVTIAGRPRVLRIVAAMMNLRSRLTGIATGDQGMFVERALFDAAGGFAEIPLMEDIALSKSLKRQAGRPACLRERITTSGRRWETRGPWRTILTMWRLRLAFALGADPARLARDYR